MFGCVTEAELRAAAEARDIVLTEEQVQAFMALEADGVCVCLEAFLNSLDGSVEGVTPADAIVGGFNWMVINFPLECQGAPSRVQPERFGHVPFGLLRVLSQ